MIVIAKKIEIIHQKGIIFLACSDGYTLDLCFDLSDMIGKTAQVL